MSRALDARTAPPTPVTIEDAQSLGALLASSRSAETRRSYASAMRTGHATSAAEAGIDPMTISRTTRHRRSDSLARYVRPAGAGEDSTAGKIGL